MVVKENALLPRHTQTISALVSALQRENGQVLVRPPGFGKTRTAIATIIRLAQSTNTPLRCLVLAPTVLQDTWCREVAAVSTARFAAVKRGTSAKTMRTLNDAHFVFVSHRMLVSGNAYALSPAINWPYIILDEAHQIRQPSTCINARIRELRDLNNHAKMLLLTATPFINCAIDVTSLLCAAAADWTLLNYLGLPTQQHYTKLLINSDTDRSWLKNIECTKHFETLDMLADEQEQYNNLISEFIHTYDHCTAYVKAATNIRGSLMRLRRQLEAPTDLCAAQSSKMKRLVEIIQAVPQTQRTIVFCIYRSSIIQVQRVIQTELGRRVFCLHGGVAKTQRAHILEEWEGTRSSVLVAQLFVAGVGLNLQSMCATAIFLLRWYNKPMEEQAVGRICRFGQRHNTNVYFLRYNVYIETTWIDDIHAQKEAEQKMLLEEGCDDDLTGMHVSHMETLRVNLLETRLQHPIEDGDPTEDGEHLGGEFHRKRPRVHDPADAEQE